MLLCYSFHCLASILLTKKVRENGKKTKQNKNQKTFTDHLLSRHPEMDRSFKERKQKTALVTDTRMRRILQVRGNRNLELRYHNYISVSTTQCLGVVSYYEDSEIHFKITTSG